MIIETPRRLHLGLIDPSGSLGRRFGSLGVALENGYRIKLLPHDSLVVRAEGEDVETVKSVVKRMNERFGTGFNYFVEIERAIPRHVGLGSTTQLSLGLALGIARLNGVNASVEELASLLGRGKNSGTGIYAFKLGGFVLDGGVRGGIPPLIFREEFPEDWAFILVTPEVEPGLDEEEEKPVMEGTSGNIEAAREISHRILLGLLPALRERDIEAFGWHLSEIQRLVGKHFESTQGGEFREDVRLIVDFLREKTYGAGQSSWGPTVYGLIDRELYLVISAKLNDFLREQGIRARVELGVVRNRGAEVISENTYLERLIRSVGGR